MKVELSVGAVDALKLLSFGPQIVNGGDINGNELRRHGFAKSDSPRPGYTRYSITDAGKQWLAENAK